MVRFENILFVCFLIIVLGGCSVPGNEQFSSSSAKIKVLVLGAPSDDLVQILQENSTSLEFEVVAPQTIESNAAAKLAGYRIIVVDQTKDETKAISTKVGAAVQNFVRSGGSLIVIGDSGITRPDKFDVIGWENTFGDLMPVTCERVSNNLPSCKNPIVISGNLISQTKNHPIFQDVNSMYYGAFTVFDIEVTGNEIAYIDAFPKTYPAIVEKNLPKGKVIYFNYAPRITKNIFINAINYMK